MQKGARLILWVLVVALPERLLREKGQLSRDGS